MLKTRHALVITPILLLLGACASTPDPAEVCTAEWIEPRANAAVSKIQKRAGSSIRSLSKASESVAAGKTPNFLQIISMTRSLNKMKKELTSGQGIRDLRTVAKTCNDPNLIKDSMHSLLQRQGVSEGTIQWMENNPIYENLISRISEPTPVQPNG